MKYDQTFLKHILDAIEKIESYTEVGYEVFKKTYHWQDAIIRELEIIGEASKKISDELKKKSPEIPWKRITGLRDILIHAYMSVDLEAVWNVTQKNLPLLKEQIKSLLKK